MEHHARKIEKFNAPMSTPLRADALFAQDCWDGLYFLCMAENPSPIALQAFARTRFGFGAKSLDRLDARRLRQVTRTLADRLTRGGAALGFCFPGAEEFRQMASLRALAGQDMPEDASLLAFRIAVLRAQWRKLDLYRDRQGRLADWLQRTFGVMDPNLLSEDAAWRACARLRVRLSKGCAQGGRDE